MKKNQYLVLVVLISFISVTFLYPYLHTDEECCYLCGSGGVLSYNKTGKTNAHEHEDSCLGCFYEKMIQSVCLMIILLIVLLKILNLKFVNDSSVTYKVFLNSYSCRAPPLVNL